MSDQRANQGIRQRDKAITAALRRKEEYLGARVPKELRDRVIARAKELGIPVSILIRNILEDAFNSNEVNISSSVNADEPAFDSVLAWEEISLNKSVSCSKCGVSLIQGERAFMGLGITPPVVICGPCKS